MGDCQIRFTAPEVRALLAGTKTQTRRVAKITAIMGNKVAITASAESLIELEPGEFRKGIVHYLSTSALSGPYHLPYKVGDRLWVREAWRCEARYDDFAPSELKHGVPTYYAADPDPRDSEPGCAGRLRASMHMPRWASRLTLVVTDVRVERLQDIGTADAMAEGITHEGRGYAAPGMSWVGTPELAYRCLWNAIHGDGSWDANPWVAAYTFTVHHQNIDAMPHPARSGDPS
jgi:hypothetical protein